MPNLITAKIDLKKVLQEHLFNANSGAQYLDIILIPSKSSQFGDTHFIVQGVNKATRDAGIKGPIIGNAKEKGGEGVQDDAPQRSTRRAPATPPPPPPQENIDEDVPF
jgi:hypothetical protein